MFGSALTLGGMFLFRRFMAERSIAYVVGFLTLAGFVLALPIVGLYYGLHHWTAAMTGGLVDARTIVIVDTTLESPLGQIAMIPMLAWIANSAPANLKATYFAVMASFTNLALSLSQLGTKYLNEIFIVTREVRDGASGALVVPAAYSQLGDLLIIQVTLGLALLAAATTATRAQVVLHPEILSGTVQFNNANPEILSLFNAPGDEGMSNLVVDAVHFCRRLEVSLLRFIQHA